MSVFDDDTNPAAGAAAAVNPISETFEASLKAVTKDAYDFDPSLGASLCPLFTTRGFLKRWGVDFVLDSKSVTLVRYGKEIGRAVKGPLSIIDLNLITPSNVAKHPATFAEGTLAKQFLDDETVEGGAYGDQLVIQTYLDKKATLSYDEVHQIERESHADPEYAKAFWESAVPKEIGDLFKFKLEAGNVQCQFTGLPRGAFAHRYKLGGLLNDLAGVINIIRKERIGSSEPFFVIPFPQSTDEQGVIVSNWGGSVLRLPFPPGVGISLPTAFKQEAVVGGYEEAAVTPREDLVVPTLGLTASPQKDILSMTSSEIVVHLRSPPMIDESRQFFADRPELCGSKNNPTSRRMCAQLRQPSSIGQCLAVAAESLGLDANSSEGKHAAKMLMIRSVGQIRVIEGKLCFK
jgi:hypothetical protein